MAARRGRDPRPSAGARMGAERRPGRGERCPPCAGRAALPAGGDGRAARHRAEAWDARTGAGVPGVGSARAGDGAGRGRAREGGGAAGGSGGRGLRAWRVPPGCAARSVCEADRGHRQFRPLRALALRGFSVACAGESPVTANADSAGEERVGRCCRPFYWLLFSGSSSDGENSP